MDDLSKVPVPGEHVIILSGINPTQLIFNVLPSHGIIRHVHSVTWRKREGGRWERGRDREREREREREKRDRDSGITGSD